MTIGSCFRRRRCVPTSAHPRRWSNAEARQSRCLEPLLSTTFQRLLALVPPLPEKSTGEASDTAPLAARPPAKVLIGSRQLSSTALQVVPLVGAEAVAKTPCARLSEP